MEFGSRVFQYLAGPALMETVNRTASEIPQALDAIQHATHAAEETAKQIRSPPLPPAPRSWSHIR